MQLWQRIQAWRLHFRVSQWKLAAKIGDISPQAIGQWEVPTGTEPTHDNLERFCSALGITMAQFWGAPPKAAPTRRARKAS